MKAICIGQAAYDITLIMDSYPIENQRANIKEKIECGGGSASNCAILLEKWEIDTSFAGTIGNDYYGNKIKDEFDRINTKYLDIKDATITPVSYIITAIDNNTRTILKNRKKDIKISIKYDNEKYDLIMLDGYEKDFASKVLNNNKTAISILDAGSIKEETLELAKKVKILACSKDFAEEYTNIRIDFNDINSLISIHKKLEQDFNNIILITLEDKGCFIKSDNYKIIPSIQVDVKDTTAAGDIFHGALGYFLLNDTNLENAVKKANIAGALSVGKIGGRNSIPDYNKVEEVYDALSK